MRITGKGVAYSIFLALVFFITFYSCKKDSPPANPYDSVNYKKDSTTVTADPNTIVGLHSNIFFPRCAKSGCHDGTFEPDYRTVQSTYATLVYQPVIKTNCYGDSVHFFKLRVIPYDTTNSFLHERLVTSTSDYMPSNGSRLSRTDINHINNWIMNGARDQNGVVPVLPDLPPQITGYIAAYDSIFTQRIDTPRVNNVPYNPFIVQQGRTFYMIFGVTDDSTAYANLTVNQLKLSLDKDDFSGATTVSAINVFGYWILRIYTFMYSSGTTVYFRYYVNDGHHATPSEFPRTDSPTYYKSYASFKIQ